MKLFKWSDFINESNEDIHQICRRYGIKNYTIKDGLVNVDGNVKKFFFFRILFKPIFLITFHNFYMFLNVLESLQGNVVETTTLFRNKKVRHSFYVY